MAVNDEENAKSDVANAAASADAPSSVTLAEEGDRKAQGVASTEVNDEPADTTEEANWANFRTPFNLEAKDDTADDSNWANVRTPLNLEATDSVSSLAFSGGDAAQPWWNVRNTLTLEAKEAKQLAVGTGRQLEALVGNDQLHLLMGGSLLLVAGVIVGFARRARKQKAADKVLEDETYLLMA